MGQGGFNAIGETVTFRQKSPGRQITRVLGQHLIEGSNGILVLAREVLLIPLFKKAFAGPKQEQRKKSQCRKNGFHRSASEV
jgi:hypothetical protein